MPDTEPQTRASHEFDLHTECCIRCGVRREQVADRLGEALDRLLSSMVGECHA